jgi:nitrite reductase (NADH) small subunit
MTMTKHYKLGLLSEIPCGEGRNFVVEGIEVAVFRTRDDALFATQAHCPHRAGPLADGLVGTRTLVCPLHEWSFDLTSGQAITGSCGLTMYPVSRGGADEIVLELLPEAAE